MCSAGFTLCMLAPMLGTAGETDGPRLRLKNCLGEEDDQRDFNNLSSLQSATRGIDCGCHEVRMCIDPAPVYANVVSAHKETPVVI